VKSIGKLRLSLVLSDLDVLLNRLAELFPKYDVVEVKAEIPLKLFCFWRPHHLLKLYTQKSTAIAKPPHNMMEREEWLMGGHIVTDTGVDWKRKKQMYDPLFRATNLDSFCRFVPAAVERMRVRLDPFVGKEPIDIFWEMRRLIIDLSFEMFFSEILGDELDRVSKSIEFAEAMFPVQIPPFFLPTPNNLRFRREGKYLKKLMREILMRRRANPTEHTDLLTYFFNTEDSAIGRKWTDDELVNEMFVIFGTSAMTTALGWGIYLLAQHPSVLRKLEGQMGDVFLKGVPSIRSLDENSSLEHVFKEILRLYPPFWGSVRYSESVMEMDGYRFPARSTFLPIRFFSQRHEEYWSHPLAFDPDRFGNNSRIGPTSKDNPSHLLPFGAGPRTCLGVHLAPMICKLILALVIHQYSFEFQAHVPNGQPRVKFGYGLYPADKVHIFLHNRNVH